MSNLPVPVREAGLPSIQLAEDLAAAKGFARASVARSTQVAYRSGWTDFETWCKRADVGSMPAQPDSVAAYLAHLAKRGLKASTIDSRCAAIAWVHKRAGHLPPTSAEVVKNVLSGIRRTIGTAQAGKAPATAEVVRALVKAIAREAKDSLTAKRDLALLLIGFAAALRRSELVALELLDLERAAGGVRLHIRWSKTDQEGQGQVVAVPRGKKLRPVDALDGWLAAAAITGGPVFRRIRKGGQVSAEALTPQSVALIVKRWAKAAKLDPALFSGHSLRSGLITQALIDEIDVFQIMDVSRHTEVKTLRQYDRRARDFTQHAGRKSL